jgi:hypothetical protein
MTTKDPLSSKSVDELRTMARSLGLRGYSRLRKEELVRLLHERHTGAHADAAPQADANRKAARPAVRSDNTARPAATSAPAPHARAASAPQPPRAPQVAPAGEPAFAEPPAQLVPQANHVTSTEERIETAKYAQTPYGTALSERALGDLHEDIDRLPLPAEPIVALLPQKPGILHAYWMLTPDAPPREQLRLRLCRANNDALEILDEIRLPGTYGHWYFHVPEDIATAAFWLHLGHYVNGDFVTAVRRGIVRIPSLYAAERTDRQWWVDEDLFRTMYLRAGGVVRTGQLAWPGSASSPGGVAPTPGERLVWPGGVSSRR